MADQNTNPSLRRVGRRRQMTSGPLSPARSLPSYIYHLAIEPPQIQFMDSPLASHLLELLSNYSYTTVSKLTSNSCQSSMLTHFPKIELAVIQPFMRPLLFPI